MRVGDCTVKAVRVTFVQPAMEPTDDVAFHAKKVVARGRQTRESKRVGADRLRQVAAIEHLREKPGVWPTPTGNTVIHQHRMDRDTGRFVDPRPVRRRQVLPVAQPGAHDLHVGQTERQDRGMRDVDVAGIVQHVVRALAATHE